MSRKTKNDETVAADEDPEVDPKTALMEVRCIKDPFHEDGQHVTQGMTIFVTVERALALAAYAEPVLD